MLQQVPEADIHPVLIVAVTAVPAAVPEAVGLPGAEVAAAVAAVLPGAGDEKYRAALSDRPV